MIRTITLISCLFAFTVPLTGCNSTPQKQVIKEETSLNKVAEITQPEAQPTNKLADLEQEALQAKNNHDWPNFITLAEQLWQQADPANQMAIEYQVWSTINKLSLEERSELTSDDNNKLILSDWLDLAEVTHQHPVWQTQALKDLTEFNANAIYTRHLVPEILNKLKQPYLVHNIAVLLPFNGPYAEISHQIRNGILKNHYQKHQNLRIQFFDSSQPETVQQTYQTAIQQGAEWIIGPLTKEALQQLEPLHPQNLIALNQIDADFAQQFSYKSENEPLQIAKKLCSENYKHIGILSSTATSDAQLAEKLAKHWAQASGHQAILKTYPTRNPNLRKAVGSVINETRSQARKNNLRWLLNEKITFTPRIREDLEAIVLVGNTRQLAVFRPQFKFFELNLPTYATSKITPKQLKNTHPNKDLSRIMFPTIPAAYQTTSLTSPFEAFGWDSLTLVLSQDKLAPGICLNNGMMGRLSLQGHHLEHTYEWAKYNTLGRVVALEPASSAE